MRIAILSSEVVPFAKTGGLADIAGALPKALRQKDQGAVVVPPLYQQVKRELLSDVVIEDVPVPWRDGVRPTRVWQSEAAGAPAYLIDAPEFFSRPSIYGYQDDHARYAFFSRAVLALFKHLEWQPDSDDFMLNGMASALKAGLVAADALSTVSRRYAEEIQTPEQGYGLDWLFRARRDRLAGITNGVDYDLWNPETDPHIAANFTAKDLSGKRECKIDLLRRFGLPEEPERPIIAIISRLVAQKGYDLIRQLANEILQTG